MPSARNGDSPSVIVRTALEPLTLLPLVRAEVARIDQGVAVATRRREFGIRLACGARPSDVMRDVFRRGLTVTTIGLGLGLAGAAGAARLIGSQLYQVGAADPFVAVTTVATVMGAAFAACWLPAWRASRTDPASALRAD